MKREMIRILGVLLFFFAALAAASAQQPLALQETQSLSPRDRIAAANAESEALDRDEVINGVEWKGPDGGGGLLIVSGRFPSVYGMGACRRLIHIIRHPGDGGVNPTFDHVVCRGWEGKWLVGNQ